MEWHAFNLQKYIDCQIGEMSGLFVFYPLIDASTCHIGARCGH